MLPYQPTDSGHKCGRSDKIHSGHISFPQISIATVRIMRVAWKDYTLRVEHNCVHLFHQRNPLSKTSACIDVPVPEAEKVHLGSSFTVRKVVEKTIVGVYITNVSNKVEIRTALAPVSIEDNKTRSLAQR